jgi:hypothetical protein
MDGQPDALGDIFSPDSVMVFPEKVPVFANNKLVGICSLTREINVLKYEIEKNFAITEEMLYGKPCVAGFIAERDGNVIKRCSITSISIDLNNADNRIKKIKDDQ